jgi:SAM-dependent methyltransferase
MTTLEERKAYWADKDSPLHRSDTPEFYRVYAQELKILFSNISPTRVLEIGCGNGAMFEYLGFDRVEYKGVDFSPRLLAAFKARYPCVDVECRDASSYVNPENKYDLIFSNEVIQDFDLTMLGSHFGCARMMMNKDSLLVCASIPWRLHRPAYYRGRLTGTMEPSILRLAKAGVARLLFGDPMGRWHEPRGLARLAERHGLTAEFYGSMTHLYRFHAVVRLK